jgi:hypothetical protein
MKINMKFRCTASFVLAGWCLLYPPWSVEKHAIDPELPLDRWYEVATFDSYKDCEAQKTKVLEDLERHTHSPSMDKVIAELRLRPQARCISLDDPQLKDR